MQRLGVVGVIEPPPLRVDFFQEPERDPTGGLLHRLLQEITDGRVVGHGDGDLLDS